MTLHSTGERKRRPPHVRTLRLVGTGLGVALVLSGAARALRPSSPVRPTSGVGTAAGTSRVGAPISPASPAARQTPAIFASAVSGPSTVEVLGQVIALQGTGGSFAFVVHSPADTSVAVSGVAAFSDAAGQVIATVPFLIPAVGPHGRTGWVDDVPTTGGAPARMTIEARAGPPVMSFEVVVETAALADTPWRATAVLENHNAVPLRRVRVNAVAYDAQGRIVGGGYRIVAEIVPHTPTSVDIPLTVSGTPTRTDVFPIGSSGSGPG